VPGTFPGDSVRANAARLNAIDLMNQARAEGQSVFEEGGADDAVTADVLRRAGRFDRAADTCRKALSEHFPKGMQNLLEFQIELCQMGDANHHTLEEVSTLHD
jgi:hypothetical protein